MSDLLPWMAPWSGRILTAATCLLGLALFIWAVRGRRLPYPHCPKCFYNLTGTRSDTCPECGADTPAARRDKRRRRTRLGIVGLLIFAAMPIFVTQRRIRQHGWDYYLRFEPLYTFFPMKCVDTSRHGPFTVRHYEDQRYPHDGEYDLSITVIDPGGIRLEGGPGPHSWYTQKWGNWNPDTGTHSNPLNGVDLTGNGRPNLWLRYHLGFVWDYAHADRLYELVNGRAVLIDEHVSRYGTYEDIEGNGVYSWIEHSESEMPLARE